MSGDGAIGRVCRLGRREVAVGSPCIWMTGVV